MKINDAIFLSYLLCPYKAGLLLSDQSARPTAHQILMADLANCYEPLARAAISRTSPDVVISPNLEDIRSILKDGPSLILDARIEIGDFDAMRVLRYAKVWRRIRDDVTRLSERDIKPVARVLKPEEKTRLFQVASSNPNWTVAYAAGLIAANTTARGADLKGLHWSDVDLFEGVIAIPNSKSEAGKRRIPLNPDEMLGFRTLFERANKLEFASPEYYVFPACEHLRIDATRAQKTWRTSWRNLTRAAGPQGTSISRSSASVHYGIAGEWRTGSNGSQHRRTCLTEDDGALQPH